MMKKILFTFLLLIFSSAHAGLFQGNSFGMFVNPTAPSGGIISGAGGNRFSWGSEGSYLEYEGVSFDVNLDEAFVFGTLTYFNAASVKGTSADSVDLNVALRFTSPLAFSGDLAFDLGLINTPNTLDDNASADIVYFDNLIKKHFFSFPHLGYTLEFLGFAGLARAGFRFKDSFSVLEGDSKNIVLVGRIIPDSRKETAVPEPATLWLSMLGLFGISVKKFTSRDRNWVKS